MDFLPLLPAALRRPVTLHHKKNRATKGGRMCERVSVVQSLERRACALPPPQPQARACRSAHTKNKIRATRSMAGLRSVSVRSARMREGRSHCLPPGQLETVRAGRKKHPTPSPSRISAGIGSCFFLVFFLTSEKARAYFAGIELVRVALAVKEDETASPVDVGLLSPVGIVNARMVCRSRSSSRTAGCGEGTPSLERTGRAKRRCHDPPLPSSKFANVACTGFFWATYVTCNSSFGGTKAGGF